VCFFLFVAPPQSILTHKQHPPGDVPDHAKQRQSLLTGLDLCERPAQACLDELHFVGGHVEVVGEVGKLWALFAQERCPVVGQLLRTDTAYFELDL
jgi:hypothetical protein